MIQRIIHPDGTVTEHDDGFPDPTPDPVPASETEQLRAQLADALARIAALEDAVTAPPA